MGEELLRNCKNCKKVFDAYRKDNIFCTPKCRSAFRNKKNRLAIKREITKCIWCGIGFVPKKYSNKDNNLYCTPSCGRNSWIHKLKIEALTKYSFGDFPKCECCGENNLEFLTIDHIYKNGAKHRKEIGYMHIYQWLKKENYPEGYRVLCLNCNCSRGFYGYCPHKEQGKHRFEK